MWWLMLLFSFVAVAQTQEDLKAIQDLNEELPHFVEIEKADEEIDINRQSRGLKPPRKIIPLEDILQSGTQVVSVPKGVLLQDLKALRSYSLPHAAYLRVFNLEDELGYKYVQDPKGKVTWRFLGRYADPIKEELALHEPPLHYTPAPKNLVRTEYDRKLSIPPEFSFYAGLVKGSYMADLFNDQKASHGVSNQYGLHFFTEWRLPVKAGGVLHYEKTTYDLSDGNTLTYTSLSFGPQLKTRDFEVFSRPVRLQMQLRVSPFARTSGAHHFKFNSTDLLASAEHPIKNGWGEFVIGLYLQEQWLNLKDQKGNVDIHASNKTNRSFGLSFSQVFP